MFDNEIYVLMDSSLSLEHSRVVVCYCWIVSECYATGSHISKEVKMKIKHLGLWWKNYTTGIQAYSTYSNKWTLFTWVFLLLLTRSLASIKAYQLHWEYSKGRKN